MNANIPTTGSTEGLTLYTIGHSNVPIDTFIGPAAKQHDSAAGRRAQHALQSVYAAI